MMFGTRWRMERPLAEGGQAETFLVTDETGGLAVLKRAKNPHEARWFARVVREAEVLSRLAHPNVVRFIDAELHGEAPYIVTEYCAGGTLADAHLDDVSAIVRVQWCERIVDAVAHVHRNGVIHRDLKPENIFFRGRLRDPVLGDFGLSWIPDAGNPPLLDADGPAWFRAPESQRGALSSALTPAADVYSLGKLLSWILEDCEPVHALLERATAADRALRPPDAGAFAEELRRALSSGPPALPGTPG
jgi:serine/threonine protein kinase